MKKVQLFNRVKPQKVDLLIVPLAEEDSDPMLNEALSFNMDLEGFSGEVGSRLMVTTNGLYEIPKILCVGMGKRSQLTPAFLQKVGRELAHSCLEEEIAVYGEKSLLAGMILGGREFCGPNCEEMDFFSSLAEGQKKAYHLISSPSNLMTPQIFAAECKKLSALGIEVEMFGEKQLQEQGMGALLAVGAGSVHSPQLVVMRWRGAAAKQPIGLVGKGVCFDAGGINLKRNHLPEMKFDKAGAGVVVGVLNTLALLKAPVDVVGVIGLAENMPDGGALKPGDVITTHSGKSVEVVDTDNEGRLILADCLSYAEKRFSPECLIDLGTLTLETFGVFADAYAGLFCPDDTLSKALKAVGEKTGEKLWSLPLGEPFASQVHSTIADIKNIGVLGFGESSAAAEFLRYFVRPSTRWAHLDIAGVSWTQDAGVTAFGVHLLVQFLISMGV